MQYHQTYDRPDRAAAENGKNRGRARRAQSDDVLWFDDLPTDDPAPASDPQSGDVTDGSVDYFDFNWGEEVAHDEDEMEPRRISCAEFGGNCAGTGNGCGCDDSHGDGCDDSHGDGCGCRGDCGGGDDHCAGGDNGCGGDGGCHGDCGGGRNCADNSPDQVDDNEYEIVDE